MQNYLGLLLILAFAVMIADGYFVRRLTKRLPAPVRQGGQLNALIGFVGVVAVMGLLTVGIWAISNQPIVSSIIIAFGIFFLFIFSGAFVSWQRGRATSGRVLLDCGPHPIVKKLGFHHAAFSLFVFGGVGLGLFLNKSPLLGIAGMLLGVALTLFWILFAYWRLQIRENGIWGYGGFLKWERLKSYKWEGDWLLVDVKTRFPFFGKRGILATSEYKPSIEEYLSKHCTAQSDA